MLEEPPFDLLCPGRRPTGIGPVLLPADVDGQVDWRGFAHLLGRVAATPLLPAVNLGVGAVTRLTPVMRAEVLATTGAAMGGQPFVAGVRAEADADGAFEPGALAAAVEAVARFNAVPVLLPSPTLGSLSQDEFVGLVAWMGDWCDRLLVVEGGSPRWGGGQVPGLDVFGALMEVEACIGVVHASGRRLPEWDRLRARDEARGSFQVFSANDRAVDQIMYGSDHCMELAAAVPDVISTRDERWGAEDPEVLELQDAIQALSTVVFCDPPTTADHLLARILHLRGWLEHDRVLGDPPRGSIDDAVLGSLLERLGL